MKKIFLKKLGAALLAVVMLCTAMPFAVSADETSSDAVTLSDEHEHWFNTDIQPANYTECGGGSKVPYHECGGCRKYFDENGNEVEYAPRKESGHTPGEFVGKANYAPCSGGYTEDRYACAICGDWVDINGKISDYELPTAPHTPGKLVQPANYTECGGGYLEDGYDCANCNNYVILSNSGDHYYADFAKGGTGEHNWSTELYPAKYTHCGGGYEVPHYICITCDNARNYEYWQKNENGEYVGLYTRGDGEHTWGTELYPADYTPCTGGFKEAHYLCTVCHEADNDEFGLNEDGVVIPRFGGKGGHTFDANGKCTVCGYSENITPSIPDGLNKVDGVWKYYKDGEVDTSYTGAVRYNGGIFYVTNGIMDTNYAGLVKFENAWLYIANGRFDGAYNGAIRYNGGIFYVTNGVMNWSYTGLTKFENAWIYVKSSRFDGTFTNAVRYNGGIFYINKGVLNWSYTGLTKFDNAWIYITKSRFDGAFTNVVNYNGGIYYVTKGVLNWSYTGMAKYNNTWYYIVNSKRSFYNGTVKQNGVTYTIKNGIATSWK